MSKQKSMQSVEVALRRKKRTERITRVIALIFAFLSVFGFVVKLLFF